MRGYRDKVVASAQRLIQRRLGLLTCIYFFFQQLQLLIPFARHSLFLGDVTGRLGCADDTTLSVPNRRNGKGDIQSLPIFGLPYGFEVVDLVSAPDVVVDDVFLRETL